MNTKFLFDKIKVISYNTLITNTVKKLGRAAPVERMFCMAPREKLEEVLIVNRRTGKVLHCTGPDNGLVVVQAEPTGEDAQIWNPVRVDNGVKLVNKASGKVLDVVDGGTEAGTWAHTWEDVSANSQVWKLERITATYRKIVNVQAGKVLDIVDMREDDGAPVQIWDDVEGSGQQWKLVTPAVFAAKGAKSRVAKKEASAQEEKPKATRTRAKKTEAVAEVKKPKTTRTRTKKTETAPAEAAGDAPKKRGRKPAKKA